MVDLKNLLNPSQLEAVTTADGPVLVIAGAGSGKTRVIEYRVLYMVQNGIRPDSILLLTFTRKAAQEMLSRASSHDPRCQKVEGGTFHSFGLKVIRRYGRRIGINRRLTILDEGDSEEAIHRCATRFGIFLNLDEQPKKTTLRNIISMSINQNRSIRGVVEREYPHFDFLIPRIEVLQRKYSEYKKEKGYLDYDDLLIYLKNLLEDEEVRQRFARKLRYVMVDEYQDTNCLQRDITYLLGDIHQNLMVVGDDAQSIYGFRGATFKNIFDFPEKFPNSRIIKLEDNYRSTQAILDVANSVLDNMARKYAKCLKSARGIEGSTPEMVEFADPREEAEWIIDKIFEFQAQGYGLEQQGVLFRAAFVSIPLQAELNRRQIPYQVFGGLRFYETAHIKDVISHLKVIANFEDELAWNRVLLLIEGIGPATAEYLIEDILSSDTFDDAVTLLGEKAEENGRYKFGLSSLSTVLTGLDGNSLPVERIYSRILEYYYPIFRKRYDDWKKRLPDLEVLRGVIGNYQSLDNLLDDLAIEPPSRVALRSDPDLPQQQPLTLSTIHSAKGLEWDVVFLIGLVDGVLPSSFTFDIKDDLEEERRLFYVGITRAKDNLLLTMNREGYRTGGWQFNQPSRFVEEIRSECLLPP